MLVKSIYENKDIESIRNIVSQLIKECPSHIYDDDYHMDRSLKPYIEMIKSVYNNYKNKKYF
jgi:hypothetical protein